MSDVIWHDVECGGYAADLPLWRELAAAEAGPVLDVGAGRRPRRARARPPRPRRHRARPRRRAAGRAGRPRRAPTGLAVRTEVADAAGFELAGAPFGLIAVPMQTIQLLPGRAARAAFLASAREHLASGGLVALAVSEELEPFEVDPSAPLPPDRGERDGWRYLSFPVAIRPRGDVILLERVRQAIAPDGSASVADDTIELASLTADELEAEAGDAGLRPEPRRRIDDTDAHVGSTVVMLRG